jgi:2'-5' RNA ligase
MSGEEIRTSKDAHEYSIWLMPSGETYRQLSGLIFRLSQQYASPNFEPHVTLLGGLMGTEEELVSKTLQLAALLRPFTVELDQVEYLDEYFRSLFVRVKETRAIMEANKQARLVLGHKGGPAYMPHMSLMYGDKSPDLKEEIIDRIGRKFEHKFPVTDIYLFSTASATKDWYRVRDFSLG